MNEFKDMNSTETLAEMLRDHVETAWAQAKETIKKADDALIKDFEFFLKGSPSTFKLLTEIPNTDKEREGFNILMNAIMHDASSNFLFYEIAGGRERLTAYLDALTHRISALESQNKLLMETINELSKEK